MLAERESSCSLSVLESMGSPSDLPDFETLTKAVAAASNVPVNDDQLAQLDLLL